MLSASSKSRPRRIALVDCNNFYCSCERVFQPQWQHRPIAVLSNNDGCIVARSNELKALDVPMGVPYFKWKRFLEQHNAVVLSSNYTLYGDMSARVMHTLGRFTPEIDIYSIDEAWLDLTGFNPATLDAYGREIVQTVRQWTGIPVSIGIAPTRVLAKIANRIAKQRQIPGGVFNLGGSRTSRERSGRSCGGGHLGGRTAMGTALASLGNSDRTRVKGCRLRDNPQAVQRCPAANRIRVARD